MILYQLFVCYYDDGCGSSTTPVGIFKNPQNVEKIKSELIKKGYNESDFRIDEIDTNSLPDSLTKEGFEKVLNFF